MSKPVSKKDMEFFREAMDKLRFHEEKNTYRTIEISYTEHIPTDQVQADTILHFSRPGVPKHRLRALKESRVSQQATLDLHGMTQETAKKAIIVFLQQQIQKNQYHTVLIIHGKGNNSGQVATLKNLANHLLRQLIPVLAFCSAQPYDGGSGALYVLLQPAEEAHA